VVLGPPNLKVAPPLTKTAYYVNNCEKSGEKKYYVPCYLLEKESYSLPS